MAEAMLAHPPSYFGLERSLHCETPGNRLDRLGLGLKARKRWTSEGYCGRGRRSKASPLREKNPMQSQEEWCPAGMPDPWKSPIPLEDTGFLGPSKDGIRDLDSLRRPIHTRLRLESDFGLLPLVYCG